MSNIETLFILLSFIIKRFNGTYTDNFLLKVIIPEQKMTIKKIQVYVQHINEENES